MGWYVHLFFCAISPTKCVGLVQVNRLRWRGLACRKKTNSCNRHTPRTRMVYLNSRSVFVCALGCDSPITMECVNLCTRQIDINNLLSQQKKVSCWSKRSLKPKKFHVKLLTETGVRRKCPVHLPQVMINSLVNYLHVHSVEPLQRSFNTAHVIVLFPVGYVNQHVFLETECDLHKTEAPNVKWTQRRRFECWNWDIVTVSFLQGTTSKSHSIITNTLTIKMLIVFVCVS